MRSSTPGTVLLSCLLIQPKHCVVGYTVIQTIISLIFCCFISACAEQKDKNSHIANYTIHFDTKKSIEKFDMKDLTDGTFSIIPLETTDECLVAQIDKIEIQNNRIYIMDQVTHSIFVFDMNGKYLNKIHSRGQGPGEYTFLSYMTVADSSIIIIDHFTGKQIKYNAFSLQFVKEERIFEKIWATDIFYMHETIYYINDWSNSAAGKFRLFSIKNNSENFEKYLPFEKEPLSLGINGPVCATNGNEASLIYSGDNNIYRIRDGKVFPEYEVIFKDKKVEYPSGKAEDVLHNPPGRVIGINRINESDKYLFINVSMTVKDNTPIGPGHYDNYTCIHNKLDHSTVICADGISYNSMFDGGYVIRKIIDNKIIYWGDAHILLNVSYPKEELEKRNFNNKAYEERLKNVFANLNEDDNPVLFIYGLK